MRLPVLGGTLRGKWWLPQSGGKVLRILGGTYEPEQTRAFGEHLHAGGTLLDVGAHVGYYTLLSAVLVGPRGRVVAFEPNPRNCGYLRRHVRMNGCANVQVEEAAGSAANGTARFVFGSGTGTGHLAEGGTVEVQTVRLDDYCASRGIVPTAIKVDVEGAELDVLRGGEETIVAHHPVIFLSTHGASIHRACLAWLRERGYALRPIIGTDLDAATEVLGTPAGA